MQDSNTNGKWHIILLFAVPLFLYFWFGLQHISQFETADEHFWLAEDYTNVNNGKNIIARIPQYWQAMRSRDWERTDINDKPGVSLAIISGLGQYLQNGWADRVVAQNKFSVIYDPQKTEKMNFNFRLPILVCNGLIGIFVLFALKRLTKNNWTAVTGATLIILAPILIGISQIINPDSLLWSFAVASILSFMLFARDCKWWDAIFASAFLGLAFLSKYVAAILIPFFFAIMVLSLYFFWEDLNKEKKLRKKALTLALSYPAIIAGAVLIFALGMPAVFASHDALYDGVHQIKNFNRIIRYLIYADAFLLLDAAILKSAVVNGVFKYLQFLKKIVPRIAYISACLLVLTVAANWMANANFLDVPNLQYDDKNAEDLFLHLSLDRKIYLEMYPLIFSATPVVLLGIVIAFIAFSIRRKDEKDFILMTLLGFVAVFYYASIKQKLQLNVRYSVIIFPIIAIVASLGLSVPFEWKRMKELYKLPILVALVGISTWNVLLARPFYFNYTNDMLPKSNIVSGGWGYGGYEAARYIKSQSEYPQNLTVWTDYEGFCPFFPGLCIKGSQIKWNEKGLTDNIDYYVTSRRGMMLSSNMWTNLSDKRSEKPVWELNIDGRPDNYIRVYKNIAK